jgi:hypothetical protein
MNEPATPSALFDLGVDLCRAHAAKIAGQPVAKPDPVCYTPRTDEIAHFGHDSDTYIARITAFARQLERRCARLESALQDTVSMLETAQLEIEGAGAIPWDTLERARAALADNGKEGQP